MEITCYTVSVPLITCLSLVMRNEHSVRWQHFGSLDDQFASSRAVFPIVAICLGSVCSLHVATH